MSDQHNERDYGGPRCPDCGGTDIGGGYGIAGGGIGAYLYCRQCGVVFDKVQDPELTTEAERERR